MISSGDGTPGNLMTTLRGFVRKNPFKINKPFHKTQHNTCNIVWKSNTKVCNYSGHLVKGHNPYCSWRTLSAKTDRKCVLCDFVQRLNKNLLFSLGKCSFRLISWQFFPSALKTTKFTNFHRPHLVFPDFQGPEKRIPFFWNCQGPSKTMWTLFNNNFNIQSISNSKIWWKGWGMVTGSPSNTALSLHSNSLFCIQTLCSASVIFDHVSFSADVKNNCAMFSINGAVQSTLKQVLF